ncbi:MAG: hypothetical protein SPI15_08940 [Candidatus Faecousia sp.]|nr:hypothetical protein [Clostridiales bacterium]MDY6180965.1 hypothetical protein [Candidatus Faecousia sp.]
MANYGRYYIAVRLLLIMQYLEANAGKNRIVTCGDLEAFLEEHDMGVEKKTIYATCFTVQDIFLKTVHESFLSWEAHLHFLHQNKAQNAKTGSTSQLFWGVGCASLF